LSMFARLAPLASAAASAARGRAGYAAGAAASAGATLGAAYCWGGSTATNTVTKETELAATRWLRLVSLDYNDEKGVARQWQMAGRAGKPGVVAVLAVIGHGKSPSPADAETVLVCQYRPPLKTEALELPASIMSPDETVEAAALRTLKAETGLYGTLRRVSAPMGSSCGLTDECINLAIVDVDLDASDNKKPGKIMRTVNNRKGRRWPRQELKDGEFIKVHRIKLAELNDAIKQAESNGVVAWVGLEALSMGMELARSSIF